MCERVDEVDCTKSEKFYSLNLELYGSTAPPIIQADQTKPQAQSTEQTHQHAKPNYQDEHSTTLHSKAQDHSTDIIDSTEDPTLDINKDDNKKIQDGLPTHQLLPVDIDDAAEGTKI